MTSTIRLPQDRDTFSTLFTGVRHSWFRLETLQGYNAGEDNKVREFLAGRPVQPVPPSWEEMVRSHVAAGRHLSRVHVIQEPLTDYVRWELYAYSVLARAGEEVRVIPVSAGRVLAPWGSR